MNKQELMNKIKEQCGDCEAWSGTDCTRNPYTQGCLKDEKKVELTDEEIVKDIERSTGMPSYWKTIVLDLIHRLQDENKRLNIQIVQGLRDMKLEVGIRDKEIERLEEENGKLKTLVSHFEQLEKQLSAEIERLTEENADLKERYIKILDLNEKVIAEQKSEIERLKNFIDFKTANVMCDKCKEQAVKDMAKEIYLRVKNKSGAELSFLNDLALWIKERFGVAVEKWISKLN